MEYRNDDNDRLAPSDEEIRRLAVVELGRQPCQDVWPQLLEALGDPSWRVRKEAVDLVVACRPVSSRQEEIIALLRSHDNAGLRNSAVECLERLGTDAVEVLHRHVKDSDHDVRKFVVDIMGAIASHLFVPTLIGSMDDEDDNVSAAAIENLGKIGDPSAVPHLLAALERPDVLRRFTILEALCRIGQSIPVSAILPFAGENILKKAVYDCCGLLTNEESTPLLVQGLAERVRTAREAAILAIARLRQRLSPEGRAVVDAALSGLNGSPVIDGLLASSAAAEGELKDSLLTVLSLTGDDRQTALALEACRDERLRLTALDAFRRMGARAASSLRESFAAADDDQRCLILYVCAEVLIQGVSDMVGQGLESTYPPLRRVAAEAVGRLGIGRFTEQVARLLDDEVDFVVDGAVSALKRLALTDREAVLAVVAPRATSMQASARLQAARLCGVLGESERLSLLAKDEDALVRKEAVIALASLRLPSTVSALQMALVDDDADVRMAALDALGDMGGREMCESLALSLNDRDPWVCCAAIRSMERCCGPDSLPYIMPLAERSEGVVLITVLEALGSIGGDEVVSALRKCLGHHDEEVVKIAIEILSRLDCGWIAACRSELVAHPHWDVRSAFVRAVSACLGPAGRPILEEALLAEHDALVRQQIEELLEYP